MWTQRNSWSWLHIAFNVLDVWNCCPCKIMGISNLYPSCNKIRMLPKLIVMIWFLKAKTKATPCRLNIFHWLASCWTWILEKRNYVIKYLVLWIIRVAKIVNKLILVVVMINRLLKKIWPYELDLPPKLTSMIDASCGPNIN
jgi:hypothetical protein